MADTAGDDAQQSLILKKIKHNKDYIGPHNTPATPPINIKAVKPGPQGTRRKDIPHIRNAPRKQHNVHFAQGLPRRHDEQPKPNLDIPPSNIAPNLPANNHKSKNGQKADPAAVVQRGFGTTPVVPTHLCDTSQARIWPALSNEGYAQASQNIPKLDATSPKEPFFDGAAFVRETISTQEAIDRSLDHERRLGPYKGPLRAAVDPHKAFGIDFQKCETDILDDYNTVFELEFDASDQKAQYITDAVANKVPRAVCTVCGHGHIRSGPPLTLPDRDTCGSLLPTWFPAWKFDKPWVAFNLMINALLSYDEIEKGLMPDLLNRVDRDVKWHESNKAWVAIGRPKHGFWAKCRSVDEAGSDNSIPAYLEMNCRACHFEDSILIQEAEKEWNTMLVKQKITAAEGRKNLRDDCMALFKMAGKQDKAIVLACERARCESQKHQEQTFVDDDMWQSAQARKRSQGIATML